MGTLYEINDMYLRLLDEMESADEAEREIILQQLDEVEQSFKEKADSYARLMLNLQADTKAIREEAQRLTKLARVKETVIEALKFRIGEVMRSQGMTRMETGVGSWGIRKNPPAVKIIDEAAIPAQYRIPQPDAIDKAAILTAYKQDGELIPGTEVTRGESVTFR